MHNKESLDPRIRRIDLDKNPEHVALNIMEHWETYEVFHQRKRGEQHIHVGIVHAANPEMALVFAKEQFGRRLKCSNMWVTKSSNVYSFSYDDEDMFDTVPDKTYREASGFKVRDKINKFKKENTVK
jgi:ring-1,2-phenylacetyl-CoA epoxidase subunit PaaB